MNGFKGRKCNHWVFFEDLGDCHLGFSLNVFTEIIMKIEQHTLQHMHKCYWGETMRESKPSANTGVISSASVTIVRCCIV